MASLHSHSPLTCPEWALAMNDLSLTCPRLTKRWKWNHGPTSDRPSVETVRRSVCASACTTGLASPTPRFLIGKSGSELRHIQNNYKVGDSRRSSRWIKMVAWGTGGGGEVVGGNAKSRGLRPQDLPRPPKTIDGESREAPLPGEGEHSSGALGVSERSGRWRTWRCCSCRAEARSGCLKA